MKNTLSYLQENFKDYQLTIETETENFKSYLCEGKTVISTPFRVIFTPCYISVQKYNFNFTITSDYNNSFQWFLNDCEKSPLFIFSKIPKQLKNSFYKISREKLMNYLIKTKEEAWKKNRMLKKIYIDNMIRKIDKLSDKAIYNKCSRLSGYIIGKFPDIYEYNAECYEGAAALLKFEELYRRKIKNEYDKYMFDNFMTPAISEYKSELI